MYIAVYTFAMKFRMAPLAGHTQRTQLGPHAAKSTHTVVGLKTVKHPSTWTCLREKNKHICQF